MSVPLKHLALKVTLNSNTKSNYTGKVFFKNPLFIHLAEGLYMQVDAVKIHNITVDSTTSARGFYGSLILVRFMD